MMLTLCIAAGPGLSSYGCAWESGAHAIQSVQEPRFSPSIAHVLKPQVDAEGFDIEVYFSLQKVLQIGKVPFLTIEFNPKMMDAGSVK